MSVSELNARMGEALRVAMFYRNVSVEQLAVLVKRSSEQVRRWSRGEYGLKADVVVAIADALDVPTDLLLRPPASREEALAMIAAWDGMKAGRAGG